MQTRLLQLAAWAAASSLLAGCASLFSNAIGFQTGSPRIYAGVQDDVGDLKAGLSDKTISHPDPTLAFTLIDLPFSAALDTLLLPLWIPEGLRTVGRKMREGHEAVAQNVRQSRPYLAAKSKFEEIEQHRLERTVSWGQREPAENANALNESESSR